VSGKSPAVEQWRVDLEDVAARIQRLESSINAREAEVRELRAARSKLVAKRARLQKAGGIR
jgi:prefoldin subunit 5